MKKNYVTPSMKVVKIQHVTNILQTSVRSLDGNSGMGYGGAGNGPARSRRRNDSYEDWYDSDYDYDNDYEF